MTKGDESRRRDLSTTQQRALDLLATGATVKEAAEGAGVSRQTCSAWLNHNPWFQAELGQRREELWAQAKDRLRSMLPSALDAVERKLKSEAEDSWKTGLSLLKLTGMSDAHLDYTGPTNHRREGPGQASLGRGRADSRPRRRPRNRPGAAGGIGGAREAGGLFRT